MFFNTKKKYISVASHTRVASAIMETSKVCKSTGNAFVKYVYPKLD
jgi:hypothetical protein